MRATPLVELFGASSLDGGRLQRLEAAARRNDAATAFSDAKEMGRLLRSQGVSVEPLAASPDADVTAKAAHFQAVLNVQRPVSPHIWDETPDLRATPLLKKSPRQEECVRAASASPIACLRFSIMLFGKFG